MGWFNTVLCAKNMWRCFFDKGLRGKIVKVKYLKTCSLIQWIQKLVSTYYNVSIAWMGFLRSYPIINHALCWNVGHDTQIFLGIDPFIESNDVYELTIGLVLELHKKNYMVL